MKKITFLIALTFFAMEGAVNAQQEKLAVKKMFDTRDEADINLEDVFGGKMKYDYYLSDGVVFWTTHKNLTSSIALADVDFSKINITYDYMLSVSVSKQSPYGFELVSTTNKTAESILLYFTSKEMAEAARDYLKEKAVPVGSTGPGANSYVDPFAPKSKVEENKKVTPSTNDYSTGSKTDFCIALSKLINDAPNDFVNVFDVNKFEVETQSGVKTKIHPCKIQIPGTLNTEIHNRFGYTCWVEIGEYNNKSEVNTFGEAFVKKITACYPDFYVFPKAEQNNSTTIQIGRKINGAYTSPIMVIYALSNETTKKIELSMRIENGEPNTFYSIEGKALASDFGTSINRIYNEIPNKFEKIKTVEHQSDDIDPIYYYEISVKVLGANKSYVYEGSKGLNTKPVHCIASFYYGSSLEEAKKAYSKLSTSLSQAFGSEFVYTTERPTTMKYQSVLPEKPENLAIYARKKERGYESIGVCALVLNKETDGKYHVYLNFYNSGM